MRDQLCGCPVAKLAHASQVSTCRCAMPADAERVQVVLGAVVRAEQRLAWAKIMSRLGASTNIQALLSEEHGRGLPRLVGELLLAASVSTAELVIARTEMQVRQRLPPRSAFSCASAGIRRAFTRTPSLGRTLALIRFRAAHRQFKQAHGWIPAAGAFTLVSRPTGPGAWGIRSH